jgi:hypothetical protein
MYKYSPQCCEILCSKERLNVEQKLFTHDTNILRPSWKKCRKKFRRRHPDRTVPCKLTIYNIAAKLLATGSALGKKKSPKTRLQTEQKLDDIEARV